MPRPKRKRVPICEAKQLLRARGVDLKKDFFQLNGSDVGIVLDVAKAAGYRRRKDAPGSKARMFYEYVQRKRGC